MKSFSTLFFLCGFFQASLFSLPQDHNISFGQAEIFRDGNKLSVITQSNKTIIDWQSFNVALDEIASFVQPNKDSFLLNKVIGSDVSNILGQLDANGSFLLVNENGIIFGNDAVLNVENFFASTLDLKNVDFDDEMLFESSQSAMITNNGKINASKNIYLISHQIENAGSITAKYGQANLIAAAKVLIRPDSNKNIFIQVPEQAIVKEGIGIKNLAKIKAAGVNIVSDGSLYETAINHVGSIDALGVSIKKGEVYLVAKNGKIQTEQNSTITSKNPDYSGGNISIVAQEVSLLDNSVLDVSAYTGKGTIHVGGKYPIGTLDNFSSDNVYLDKKVNILANANKRGSGGKVIVYSNGTTTFNGRIFAKGGIYSGDGGYIEVSGKTQLQYNGIVNTHAYKGKLGTLFIDPTDILIGKQDTANGNFDGGSPTDTFVPNANQSYINRDNLYQALDNANVVINSASAFSGQGDISFVSPFEYIAKDINSGALTIISDNDLRFLSNFKYIAFAGSDITLNLTANQEFLVSYTMTLDNLNLNVAANDITISTGIKISDSGNINFNAAKDINFSTIGDSEITFQALKSLQLTAGNNLIIDANIDFHNAQNINLSANNEICFIKNHN